MEGKIELIEMSIINEGKQLSIRIPSKIVDALDIDTKKDVFVFQFDKENLQLHGSLEDKKILEKEFGKRN